MSSTQQTGFLVELHAATLSGQAALKLLYPRWKTLAVNLQKGSHRRRAWGAATRDKRRECKERAALPAGPRFRVLDKFCGSMLMCSSG